MIFCGQCLKLGKRYCITSFMKRSIILPILFLLLLTTSALVAQETLLHCGTDEMRQQLFNHHPELHSGIINAHKRLQTFTQEYTSRPGSGRSGYVYIIPVVFHIIHQFGTEHISDEQIYDAVRGLNLNYRKKNADTSEIVNDFKSIAADCEIELRIARKDPDGQCTKGINRIVSPLTVIGDHQVKSLIQWDPSRYLNVYVCADAAGLAGHALLPADADTIPQWDGIVIRHDYLGSVGTSNPLRSVVLSHELGHYLNLQHVWGGNNVPGFYYLPVGQAANCNYDDDVHDTPNTIGWTICNLNATSCGSLDNVQNFMDYAYCARMFTEGQKQRMHACLNSTVANRRQLWQPANHAATGIDGSISICQADFTADRTVICEGQSVTFRDQSYHDITARQWSFDGGHIPGATDSSVTVIYDTPGMYDVSLQAFSGSLSVSTTKSDFITVLAKDEFSVPFWESFEYNPGWLSNFWFIRNDLNDAVFHISDSAAYSFAHSLMLDNFSNTLLGNLDEMESRCFDLSSFAAAGTISVRFRYAFAFRPGAPTTDRLRVYVSGDCGATWVLKATLSGTSLATAPPTDQPFYPQTTQQWKQVDLTDISGPLLTDGFRIKFSFEGRGGNNLFIDDINLGNAHVVFSSTTSYAYTASSFSAYPNPFADRLYLSFQDGSVRSLRILISDITGKIVYNQNNTNRSQLTIIDLSALPPGVYVACIKGQDIEKTLRVMKY